MQAIDKLIPSEENPHEVKCLECEDSASSHPDPLMRMGIFTALAIAIHNFPEGLATFVSALQEPGVADSHHSSHCHPQHSGRDRRLRSHLPGYRIPAQGVSLFPAFRLAEPLGALLGWLVLQPVMNDTIFGLLFAGVAGIMVFISPRRTAARCSDVRRAPSFLYGLITGMVVMAVSLLLFL